MKSFYTLLILLAPFFGFSQGWIKDYTNFNGTIDVGLKVSKTGENGYVLSGFSDANTGQLNILIIKTDNYGNEEWRKIIDAGEGQDDVSFDNLYSNDLIYVVGIINEGLNPYDEELGINILGARQFIKVYNLNGDLVNERFYFPENNSPSLGFGKMIELNCGSVGSDFENNFNGPKFYAFNNYISNNIYLDRNVNKINKSNLDSIQSYETPLNPSSSNYSLEIIDIEFTSYINTIEGKGDYYSSDIYYLQNTNNNDQSDIYITSSSSEWCDINNNNFHQKYGGFENDFGYDFVLTNNNNDEPSAIVVGSTESYGNSSNYKPCAYIFKTQLYGSELTSNENNNIEWEIVIGDGNIIEIARNIVKLDNGNFLVLIEIDNYFSEVKYKIIEIDINGNILCESFLDFSEVLSSTSTLPINSLINVNSIISDKDGYSILLSNYLIDYNGSINLYYNNSSLPFANGGSDLNVVLAKVKCGEQISDIKTFDPSKVSLKFINTLGQEITNKNNSIFFEIFNDGSVEKKVIIE